MLKKWLFGLILLCSTAALAADPDYTRALQAMDQGDYQTASAIYESGIKQGNNNGHLYYNLGICYQRLNRKGEAVAAFLAARRYLPRDPDVGANLRFMLNQGADKLDPDLDYGWSQRATFWIERLTLRELAYGSAVSLAIVNSILLITIFVQQLRSLRKFAYFALIIPGVLLISCQLKSRREMPWGAVTVANSKILSGPSKGNTVIFELHEGAPFAVVNQSVGEYWQIQLSDGKKGWISRADTRVFDTP